MTVKVALVISDKNYRASPSGKGSIRKSKLKFNWLLVTDCTVDYQSYKFPDRAVQHSISRCPHMQKVYLFLSQTESQS